MTSSLKNIPRIGEILPGFLTLFLFLWSYSISPSSCLECILSKYASSNIANILITSGLIFLGSWIFGTFLDTVRNLSQHLLDYISELKWDIFTKGDQDKVQQFYFYFYQYYTLDMNYAFGIFIFLIFQLLNIQELHLGRLPCWALILLLVILCIFVWDAILLRREIKIIMDDPEMYPPSKVNIN